MKVFWRFAALLVFVAFFKTAESAIFNWTSPAISSPSGNGTLTEKINDGATNGTTTGITITATSNRTITKYNITAQTPSSPLFAISNVGAVTVSSGTVSYSSATSFTLTVTATDDGGTGTATVTLDVNAAPMITSHASSVCIADGSTEDVDLIDLAATDSNNGTTLTWEFASGNIGSVFAIKDTSGLVQVATGKTLAIATSKYTLVIRVKDDSSTPLTASTTVTASIQTTCQCSSASAIATSLMTVLAALVATNLC